MALLTLHVRKEKFCEGHIAAMIEAGHIRRILGDKQRFYRIGAKVLVVGPADGAAARHDLFKVIFIL